MPRGETAIADVEADRQAEALELADPPLEAARASLRRWSSRGAAARMLSLRFSSSVHRASHPQSSAANSASSGGVRSDGGRAARECATSSVACQCLRRRTSPAPLPGDPDRCRCRQPVRLLRRRLRAATRSVRRTAARTGRLRRTGQQSLSQPGALSTASTPTGGRCRTRARSIAGLLQLFLGLRHRPVLPRVHRPRRRRSP